MVTMKDVAKQAGVSTSTVSRVLNGKDEGRVKPEIARDVKRQAQLLGYKPNSIARSLRTHSSRILGFISDEISTTPFAGRIVLGAQDAARELGYILLAVNTGNDPALEEQEIDTIKRYGADGFLYAMMYNRTVPVPESLDGLPVVLVDARDEQGSRPSVVPDEKRIGRDATNRLLRAGCRRIMYLGADVSIVAQVERLAGYREAMEESPYGYDDRLVVGVDEQDSAGEFRRAFGEYRPDGVFCFNDVRANLVYREAARLGLTIGRDVSVVGVDNQPYIAGILSPTLTSIELPHYEMGYWGVRKLVSIIEDRDLDADDSLADDSLTDGSFSANTGGLLSAGADSEVTDPEATGSEASKCQEGGSQVAGFPATDLQSASPQSANLQPACRQPANSQVTAHQSSSPRDTAPLHHDGLKATLPPLAQDQVQIGCVIVEKCSVAG